MRIVAGKLKGRRLEAPEGRGVRPTPERAREALFDRLVHGGLGPDGGQILQGAAVLDVFCGTGALGLEAISRGAAEATFLDSEAESLAWARRNARNLGVADQCRFVRGDATRPPAAPMAHDLAFLDPPYGSGLAEPALTALAGAGWLRDGATVSVEIDAKHETFAAPAGFAEIDRRAYGKARIVLLRYGS